MIDPLKMSLEEIIKINESRQEQQEERRGNSYESTNGRRNTFQKSGGVQRGRRYGGITPRHSRQYTRDANSIWKFDKLKSCLEEMAQPSDVVRSNFGPTKLVVDNLMLWIGPLKSAWVNYDSLGRSLGTAAVIFERHSDAIKALNQYNKVTFDGRPMIIHICKTPFVDRKLGRTFQWRRLGERIQGRPQRRRYTHSVRRNLTHEDLDAELNEYMKKKS